MTTGIVAGPLPDGFVFVFPWHVMRACENRGRAVASGARDPSGRRSVQILTFRFSLELALIALLGGVVLNSSRVRRVSLTRHTARLAPALVFTAASVIVFTGDLARAPVVASEELAADVDLEPGLAASIYADPAAATPFAYRVDTTLVFRWDDGAPDLRLDRGPFRMTWRGYVLVPDDGEYTFRLRVAGRVRLRIADRIIFDASHADATWLESKPVALEYGETEIEVDYTSASERRELGVYWQSAALAPEPLGVGTLFHAASTASRVRHEIGESFERGAALARRLACTACHEIPGLLPPRRAPSLVHVGAELRDDYLLARLASARTAHAGSRMPEFHLSRNAVKSMAAYLKASATPRSVSDHHDHDHDHDAGAGKKNNKKRGKPPTPDPAEGRRLVYELGCLACHSVDGLGVSSSPLGGALDRAGEHRDAAAIIRYLGDDDEHPERVHRPEFHWHEFEREHVAAFLTRAVVKHHSDRASAAEEQAVAMGRQLVDAWSCGACHELPGDRPRASSGVGSTAGVKSKAPPLSAARRLDWRRSCLVAPPLGSFRPHFVLDDADRDALKVFLSNVHPDTAASSPALGRQLLEDEGCLNCHRRGAGEGIVTVIPQVVAREPSLRGLEGALRAPSLNAVGDKFRDGVIAARVAEDAPERRGWLRVSMPHFHHLPKSQARLIEEYFTAQDRVPASAPQRALPPAGELFVAGHRLLGAAGFGCASCHDLGAFVPRGVAPNARGPNLKSIAETHRRDWFHRWMKNPTRVAPGIEMPAIPDGMSSLLGGNRHHQMEALWHVLNSPRFSAPPESAPVRRLQPLPDGRAVIVRDVFRHRPPFGDGWTARAFAVGTPSGQHVLYDLDQLAPRAWWVGGFAGEYTRGKTWFWEPVGVPVLPRLPSSPPLAVELSGGAVALPMPEAKDGSVGQSVGQLHEWRHRRGGVVELDYTLRFAPPRDDVAPFQLRVRETVEAFDDGSRRGIRRRLKLAMSPQLANSPSSQVVRPAVLIALPPDLVKDHRGQSASLGVASASGAAQIAVRSKAGDVVRRELQVADVPQLFAKDERPGDDTAARDTEFARVFAFSASDTEFVVEYALRSRAAVEPVSAAATNAGIEPDASSATAASLAATEFVEVDAGIVPGFRAERLRLPQTVMPTRIAFDAHGVAYVSSLRGEIVRLVDGDGDGAEDRAEPISDVFAAPFGLLFDGDDLLVSEKPDLVRLIDSDRDAFFDRAVIVGAGWGLTHDYHDWVFGLARRDDGYYLALGSDYNQAGRSRSTSRWRGKAIRVDPKGEVSEVARGLRYPTGVAQNRAGEIFFTDNQGVGNTFNEINHLRAGKIYGVPSLHDPESDRGEVGEPPAIKIPHPWMRSVNGIHFLEAEGALGPFTSHGIACEYDNRRLVRFTLQRVGTTYQGACYPFSEARDGADGFLGPLCAAARSDGTIYVGSIRDSGWGGGSNIGSVVRLRFDLNSLPFGIREVRAFATGFEVDLTSAADPTLASAPENYALAAFTRVWKGGYNSPDQDRHRVALERVELSEDRTRVRLTVSSLRPGYVYELRLQPLRSEGMFPQLAYYTLNTIPDTP